MSVIQCTNSALLCIKNATTTNIPLLILFNDKKALDI